LANKKWLIIRAMGSALAIALLLFGLVGHVIAPATAAGVRILRGPYLQDVTPTSAEVCWQANVVHSATVAYGLTSDYDSAMATDKEDQNHCVRLEGLRPYTQYHYQVRTGDETLAPDATFRTLAGLEQQSIHFVAWGDHRSNPSIHHQLADVVKATDPDFVVDVGDLVDSGTSMSWWSTFFIAEHDLLATAPVYPALGNHEQNSPLYFSLFSLPGNERWYSFDSGPAHFVSLDVASSNYKPGSEQYNWLLRDLQDTMRPWKIVYMHYPAYAYAPVGGSVQAIRDYLVPLFEMYGVQLVLSGHDHFYQRNVVNGVTYVVTGGGGAPLYPVGVGSTTVYAESTYEFMKISIAGPTLSSVAVRLDGSEFDSFNLTAPPVGRAQTPAAMPTAHTMRAPTAPSPMATPEPATVATHALPTAAESPATSGTSSTPPTPVRIVTGGVATIGVGLLAWKGFRRHSRQPEKGDDEEEDEGDPQDYQVNS